VITGLPSNFGWSNEIPEVLSALPSMFVARHIRLANAVAKKRRALFEWHWYVPGSNIPRSTGETVNNQAGSAGAHPPPRNDFAPCGSQLPELRATNMDSKIDGITSGSFACPKFDGMPVITVH
jgi:hypothetical protein